MGVEVVNLHNDKEERNPFVLSSSAFFSPWFERGSGKKGTRGSGEKERRERKEKEWCPCLSKQIELNCQIITSKQFQEK